MTTVERATTPDQPETASEAAAGPNGLGMAAPGAGIIQRRGGKSAATPTPSNRTGLPDPLKSGVEAISGLSMDDVRVHYNSSRPAKLQALAYTQGAEIHVAPGQERHLPHEAWHVVQQKQGRVKPTSRVENTPINTDRDLEAEADAKGAQANHQLPIQTKSARLPTQTSATRPIVQGKFFIRAKNSTYDVIASENDANIFLQWLHSQGIVFPSRKETALIEFAKTDQPFSLVKWFNYELDPLHQLDESQMLKILKDAGLVLHQDLSPSVAKTAPPIKRRKVAKTIGEGQYDAKKIEMYQGGSLYPASSQSTGEKWTQEVKNSLISKAPEDVPNNYDFSTDINKLKRPLPSGNYPRGIPTSEPEDLLDYSGREDLQVMRHIADLIYNKVRVEEKKKPENKRDSEAEIQLMYIPRFKIMVGSGNKVESSNHLEKATASGSNVLPALFEKEEEGYGISRSIPSKYKLSEMLANDSERRTEKGSKATDVIDTAFKSGNWKFLSLLGALKTLRSGTSSQFIFINEPALDQIHAEQKLALLAVLLNKEKILSDTDEVVIGGTKIACRTCGTLLPHMKSLYPGITFERGSQHDIGSGLMWQGTITEHMDTFDKYIRNTLDPFYSTQGGLAGIGFPINFIDQARGQIKTGLSNHGSGQKITLPQRPFEVGTRTKKAKKKNDVWTYKKSKKPTKVARPSSPSPVRPDEMFHNFGISFQIVCFTDFNKKLLEAIWPLFSAASYGIDFSTMHSFVQQYSFATKQYDISNEMEAYAKFGGISFDKIALDCILQPLENSASCRFFLQLIKNTFGGTAPWALDDESWLTLNQGQRIGSVLKLDFGNKQFL